MEDFVTGRYGNQNVWEHVWVVSNVTKVGRQDDQLCALAIREVDPNFPSADIPWACGFYDDLRQLFTGIQVAGPKLAPETVDSGFHAIPAVASIESAGARVLLPSERLHLREGRDPDVVGPGRPDPRLDGPGLLQGRRGRQALPRGRLART